MTRPRRPLACRVLGCAWRFGVDGAAVTWRCRRGCPGGRHEVASTIAARRIATRLERARPGPPLGLLVALSGTLRPTRDDT